MSATMNPFDECAIEEEIEALKSIYVRELEIQRDSRDEYPIIIRLNLHPATADNTKEQYVCLTLIVKIPNAYPENLPSFEIRNPRGLSDEDIDAIVENLRTKATSNRGSPMLYELIELAKDHLTTGNRPRCSCVICLYGFSDEDAFSRTECYHYFHSHCLRRYIEYVITESKAVVKNPLDRDEDMDRVKVLCPVCREPITYDLNALRAPPPIHVETAADFSRGTDLMRLQKQMAEGFSRQKSRGGIIDVEAEKNKFLLEISAVPAQSDRRSRRVSRPRSSEVASEREDNRQKPPRMDRTTKDRDENSRKVNGDMLMGVAGENSEGKGIGRSSERGNRYRGIDRGGRKWGTNYRFGRGASGVSNKNTNTNTSATNEVAQNGVGQVLTCDVNLKTDSNRQRRGSDSDRGGFVSRGRGQRGRQSLNSYSKRTGVNGTMKTSDSSEKKRDENIVDTLASEFSELNSVTKRTNVKSNDYRTRNNGRDVQSSDRYKRTGSGASSSNYRGHFSKNGSSQREETKPQSSSSSPSNVSNQVSSDLELNNVAFVQLHERMVLTGPPCKTFSGAFSKPPPGFDPKMSAPPPPGFNES